MPHAKPSEQDEASFMNDLLAGIDASFFDAVPSPDPVSKKQPKKYFVTPAPPRPTPTLMQNVMTEEEPKSKKRRVSGALANEVEDIDALLEGAEGWDWDDMEEDFLSPRKRKKNKVSGTVRAFSPCLNSKRYRELNMTIKMIGTISRDVWLLLSTFLIEKR